MSKFNIHNTETAPEESKNLLEQAQKKYGFLPNLLGALAESGPALEAYGSLGEILGKSSFIAQEQQILFLAFSYENDCHYCMAAHSGIAKMTDLNEETINALRTGGQLPNEKHNTLAEFARKLVKERGWVNADDIDAFLAVGFTKANVFDAIVALSMKTISNYANHVIETPVDPPFKQFEWKK